MFASVSAAEIAVLVGIGGAVGANARYFLGLWVTESVGGRWPWATFLINITGSFLIGLLLVATLARLPDDPRWRLLLVTGFLGAYTTFSTFSWEALVLLQEGRWLAALGYTLGSVVVGVAAAALGVVAGRQI